MSEMIGYPGLFICLGESSCGHDEKSSCWELLVFDEKAKVVEDRERCFRASAEKKDYVRINFMPEKGAMNQKLSEAIEAIRMRLEKIITVM